MIRRLAALISLAVVFSGTFALSTASDEAKTSRNSSRRARNYFVPPRPPYTPSMVPSALGMTNAQALTEDDAVVEKEAKTSRNSSRRARNYFVPPPPPYTPSMVPSALGVTNAQALTAMDDAVVEKEAKTSRNSSRRTRKYFVPPPPPYTPSMVPSALGMTNAQALTADEAVVDKLVNPYSKNIFRRNQGDMPQVVQPNPYVSYHQGIETRILKQIDCFDSEISSHEKEIGKLLNL